MRGGARQSLPRAKWDGGGRGHGNQLPNPPHRAVDSRGGAVGRVSSRVGPLCNGLPLSCRRHSSLHSPAAAPFPTASDVGVMLHARWASKRKQAAALSPSHPLSLSLSLRLSVSLRLSPPMSTEALVRPSWVARIRCTHMGTPTMRYRFTPDARWRGSAGGLPCCRHPVVDIHHLPPSSTSVQSPRCWSTRGRQRPRRCGPEGHLRLRRRPSGATALCHVRCRARAPPSRHLPSGQAG